MHEVFVVDSAIKQTRLFLLPSVWKMLAALAECLVGQDCPYSGTLANLEFFRLRVFLAVAVCSQLAVRDERMTDRAAFFFHNKQKCTFFSCLHGPRE